MRFVMQVLRREGGMQTMCQGVHVDISKMYSLHAVTRKSSVSIVVVAHTFTIKPPSLPSSSLSPCSLSPRTGWSRVPVVHHHSPFHSMANVLDRQSTPSVALLSRVCVPYCLSIVVSDGTEGKHVTAGLTQGEKPEHQQRTGQRGKKGEGGDKSRQACPPQKKISRRI